MALNFAELANKSIRDLTTYKAGKPIEEVERELRICNIIKLASNENPLGPSPLAITAAQQALSKINLYPDANNTVLKKAIAQFIGVSPFQLTIGNGSENIYEILIKTFLSSNHSAIASQHAFIVISLLVKALGAPLVTIPTQEWRHDIKATIKACDNKTRVIFIVNPNNPTGSYTTDKELIELLESVSLSVLVVIDEAYQEYISHIDYPNTIKLLAKYPNLIIIKTFSKIYGLAGLRIGYAIASTEITEMLNRARLPFNSNLVGAAAACAALSDQDHVRHSIKVNEQGRQQLENEFKKFNITFIPSVGNFISVNVGKNAALIYQTLLNKGIIVRPLTEYAMPTFLRVTIGTYEQNNFFLKTLFGILRKNNF